jgi:hypothetical protein
MTLGSGRSTPFHTGNSSQGIPVPEVSIGSARYPLSGQTGDAPPILIAKDPGTVLHTCAIHGAIDEVYLWVSNIASEGTTIELSFDNGSTWVTKQTMAAQQGMFLLCPGIPAENVTVKARASQTDSLYILGFVLRKWARTNEANPSGAQGSGYDGSGT